MSDSIIAECQLPTVTRILEIDLFNPKMEDAARHVTKYVDSIIRKQATPTPSEAQVVSTFSQFFAHPFLGLD